MVRFTVVSAVVALLAAVAAAEDSCPAGADGKCTAAATEVATKEKAPAKAPAPPMADLITQELRELADLKQICKERIELLEDLRQTLNSGVNVSLPESHVKMFQTKLPLMSEIITAAESTPTGSADDYVFSKAVIQQEDPVSFIKFLPIRSKSSAGSSTGPVLPLSAVLVAVQADGNVRLFAPSGELVTAFSAGHDQPVTNLVVSQSLDDSMILTADAGGVIRVHKVIAKFRKQVRPNKTDSKAEKISQYLESQLNVTAQFTMQMQAPPGSDGEPTKITALAVSSSGQGGKYYVAGDSEGKVSVFGKNGSFTARIDASITPGAKVERLFPHIGHLLFHVGYEWGYINLDKLDVHHVECPDFEGHITSMVVDSQKASRLLVADDKGVVWAFNLKDKKNCKVEHSFPKRSTHPPLDLASVEGFTLAFERGGRGSDAASLVAINMTHMGKGKESYYKGAPSAVAWRRHLPSARDWTVLKRSNQGDLIAFLSNDGREVEVLELLMPFHKEIPQDNFGNFKIVAIVIAIALVLRYQYGKQKAKFQGGGAAKTAPDKFDFDAEAFRKRAAAKKMEKENDLGGENPVAGPPRSFGE